MSAGCIHARRPESEIPARRRTSSPPVGVAGAQDGRGRDTGASRFLVLANLLQPLLDGRARGDALQLAAQESLHRPVLPRGAQGEPIPYFLRDAPYGDLHCHNRIMASSPVGGNRRGGFDSGNGGPRAAGRVRMSGGPPLPTSPLEGGRGETAAARLPYRLLLPVQGEDWVGTLLRSGNRRGKFDSGNGGPRAAGRVRMSGGGPPSRPPPWKGGGVRAGRGEERGSGSRRTGRRAAPSSLLPPGRGEVGRGVDPGARRPGRGPSRSRSSVNRLGAPASRRHGGPKARILVRASRDAGGTPALPAADPPPDLPPEGGRSQGWQGGGARIGKSPNREAGRAVFSPPPCPGGRLGGDPPTEMPRRRENDGDAPAPTATPGHPPPGLPPEGGRSQDGARSARIVTVPPCSVDANAFAKRKSAVTTRAPRRCASARYMQS